MNNVYLVLDSMMAGDLFERFVAKGKYSEPDAAELVRIVLNGVQHIHSCEVMHRRKRVSVMLGFLTPALVYHIDVKPENLCFRWPGENTDVIITDFGFSRVMDLQPLMGFRDLCGTLGVSSS